MDRGRTTVPADARFTFAPPQPTTTADTWRWTGVKKYANRLVGFLGWLAVLLMAASAGWKPGK